MIPRTSIEEANKHLNLLHSRVADLEKTVKEQHEALIAKDEFLQNKVSELSAAKDEEIVGLQQKLDESERTVTVLKKQMEEKDQELAKLHYKFNNLKTLLAHKTNVRHLLKAMEEAEAKVMGMLLDAPLHGSPSDTVTPNGFGEPHAEYTDNDIKSRRRGSGKSQKPPGKEFYL
ncbi:hypothetical protein BaRGS_00013692 [Batillaria attramentaria]|uniref:Uncharacterized protein n=1 Tax=Batillaria attramentaria TaxID=370345 RepID=A0ABD0L6Q9_9CAEN